MGIALEYPWKLEFEEVTLMDTIDLNTRDLFGWFTERILEVRQTREKRDVLAAEEPMCTIYLAGLLAHMQQAPWLASLDREGPRLDIDVADRTPKTQTPRQRLEVYRSSADRYLLYLGLWDGLQGRQQGRYYQITENNLANRASAYYGFASNLAERLPPPSAHQAKIFKEFANNLGTYLGILLDLRGDVMKLFPTLTAGEEFHLCGGV